MLRILLIPTVTTVLIVTPPVRAGLINGGFESSFTGWQTTGDALVTGSSIGSGPVQGSFQALLTTASQNGDANNFSGTDAVSAADLESFLGLAASSLSPAFEGSALKQSFTANAGDVLKIRYNFLTTEGANNDFAFVTLSSLSTLADTTASLGPSAVVLDPVFGDPTSETGWRTFSFTFPAAGTYTLGIGIVDAGDEFLPSGLLLDNATLGPEIQAVPEPSALALFGLLAVCAGGCWWKCGTSHRQESQ